MEEVFEPVTVMQLEATKNQKQLSEKQIQALRDSSQTAVQAIENQTQAIRESNNALNKNLQKSIEEFDEITNRNNQLITNLVNSNQVDSSIVKTVSNLLNDKNKSQFSLEPIHGLEPMNPNLFTNNPHNPQQVLIKGSTMTFENGNTYNLNDPDLSYFLTYTQLDKEIQNENLIYNFLKDMKYDLNYGDKKSSRFNIIKYLFHPQLGSGIKFVFLPSDPDELVDQLKLIVLEK